MRCVLFAPLHKVELEIGFDAKTASLIAAQTVKGSAELLLKLNRHPEEEIDKVTTPKGCTIAGSKRDGASRIQFVSHQRNCHLI
jgi:pyrroline-5-carboxylate reductase